MTPPLPRILSAVPQTLQVRLEIAKAAQAPAAPERERQQPSVEAQLPERNPELIKECARELCREFPSLVQARLRRRNAAKAAVDDPKHPGWPAHTPDGKGGEFRPKDAIVAAADEPDSPAPGIGHNQGPPLEEPPKIPLVKPATRIALNAFVRAAAFWLAAADSWAAFKFRAALQTVDWLRDSLQLITTYSDPPKSLEELQQDAQNPRAGYNIHHIVEQTTARHDGFPDSMIDAPGNLVRIPTLKHWQISGWYQTRNEKFGGLSPRDYLRGKSWDERMRIGREALVLFGVLKP